jgi:hypothetical protein
MKILNFKFSATGWRKKNGRKFRLVPLLLEFLPWGIKRNFLPIFCATLIKFLPWGPSRIFCPIFFVPSGIKF